jgi:hypothetical protein
MLLLHQLSDGPFVGAVAERLRIWGPLAAKNLAAHVDERLDVRVLITAVLRLDVEHPVLVLDVGVVAGDHGKIVAAGERRGG